MWTISNQKTTNLKKDGVHTYEVFCDFNEITATIPEIVKGEPK
jgi:hypothetical protein